MAVDANSGDIAWSVPLGINEELAELGEVGLKSGIRNIGGSIATASGLVFIGATVDRRFRAFDAKTGKELWVTELPANGNATPITYMGKDGAQYVVIAAGGGGPAARGMAVSDSVVAFKLAPAQGRGAGAAGGAAPQGRGAGAQQPDPWPGQKHLLAVADVLSGFHHDSISHALATVEQIGRRSGAYATMIRTDSQLITKGQIAGQGRYEGRGVNARTLNYYDAIFMLPSGFGTMTDQQKADLLSFVRDEGKGLIVGHATGVAFTNWPEFGEMVGGYMDSEFNANAKSSSRIRSSRVRWPGAPRHSCSTTSIRRSRRRTRATKCTSSCDSIRSRSARPIVHAVRTVTFPSSGRANMAKGACSTWGGGTRTPRGTIRTFRR